VNEQEAKLIAKALVDQANERRAFALHEKLCDVLQAEGASIADGLVALTFTLAHATANAAELEKPIDAHMLCRALFPLPPGN
jgi:hypothetical protein